MKVCVECKTEKALANFYYQRNGRPLNKCKTCQIKLQKVRYEAKKPQILAYCSEYHMQSKFGMSQQDYELMLAKQNGQCKICGTSDPGKPRGEGPGRFSIDHCHVTGKVRGLLCKTCNAGLGHFKDKPDLLIRAIEYLSA